MLSRVEDTPKKKEERRNGKWKWKIVPMSLSSFPISFACLAAVCLSAFRYTILCVTSTEASARESEERPRGGRDEENEKRGKMLCVVVFVGGEYGVWRQREYTTREMVVMVMVVDGVLQTKQDILCNDGLWYLWCNFPQFCFLCSTQTHGHTNTGFQLNMPSFYLSPFFHSSSLARFPISPALPLSFLAFLCGGWREVSQPAAPQIFAIFGVHKRYGMIYMCTSQ